MKRITTLIMLVILTAMITTLSVQAQDAAEIMKKSHMAYYYSGDDGVSEVNMSIIDKRGKERIREFTMLRLDITDGGDQMYYTYFRKPSDVSRLTFMVHKKVESADLRWIYIPAIDLIKQISADDRNSSFVGSDFSYEDVSGRHWTEDKHSLLADSTIDGTEVFVIESIPIEAYKGFARKLTYVDKKTFLPLQENYFDKKDRPTKIFRAEKIEEIDGILTITQRSMENVKKQRKTTIIFAKISYNVGMDEKIFTERYLKNPPRKFIK